LFVAVLLAGLRPQSNYPVAVLTGEQGTGKSSLVSDFALWAEACTRAYWPAGTFLAAYRANLAASVDLVLEASPVGEAVQLFMADRPAWEGTASALLPLLTGVVTEQADGRWPCAAPTAQGARAKWPARMH
jgi:hypothetical protein